MRQGEVRADPHGVVCHSLTPSPQSSMCPPPSGTLLCEEPFLAVGTLYPPPQVKYPSPSPSVAHILSHPKLQLESVKSSHRFLWARRGVWLKSGFPSAKCGRGWVGVARCQVSFLGEKTPLQFLSSSKNHGQFLLNYPRAVLLHHGEN